MSFLFFIKYSVLIFLVSLHLVLSLPTDDPDCISAGKAILKQRKQDNQFFIQRCISNKERTLFGVDLIIHYGWGYLDNCTNVEMRKDEDWIVDPDLKDKCFFWRD